MERTAVNPPSVPATVRYGFSQAVVTQGGRRVHLSGQVGVDASGRTVSPSLEAQLAAAFGNIVAILEGLGGSLANVVVLRIYLVDSAREQQRFVGEALRSSFPIDPPATTWVVVPGLANAEWLVELEAEALLPD